MTTNLQYKFKVAKYILWYYRREAVKPGLDWSLDSGLDWTMDWTLDWTGPEEVWVKLLLAIEVMVLWLQVSRSPGCCVICRCRSGYTRLGAVGVVSAV